MFSVKRSKGREDQHDADHPDQPHSELNDDWVDLGDHSVEASSKYKARRRLISINHSPLARKIITFNLLGLLVLVMGVMYLNPFQDGLLNQRAHSLMLEAELYAELIDARASGKMAGEIADKTDGTRDSHLDAALYSAVISDVLRGSSRTLTSEFLLYDPEKNLIAQAKKSAQRDPSLGDHQENTSASTVFVDIFETLNEALLKFFSQEKPQRTKLGLHKVAQNLVPVAMISGPQVVIYENAEKGITFVVATPLLNNGETIGVIAIITVAEELELLVKSEHEKLAQMFLIAISVSVGLSVLLASTIATPLAELASAVELGGAIENGRFVKGRVRIPDLSARPDEIGRLSGALRGMVAALYDRIDTNEQFAADVAHEVKNPLASLRSAVGTLHIAKTDEHRSKLLDVIKHDVRRLDRLVSDISNASRLDSELVKEKEETFDLLHMLRSLAEYLSLEGKQNGVDFVIDLPDEPIMTKGLEARLAQVFVNLISNALSFCEEGDAIRVWVRHRENRILVVIEDTGPGIPEQSLSKIFNRFYSERPVSQFGNHSGLGLAISKQIVEAHGGVIWAENIRPYDVDITAPSMGARFVVGLSDD